MVAILNLQKNNKMKDIDKMVDTISQLDQREKMKVVFKLLGEILLENDTMEMTSSLDFGNGISIEVTTEIKLKE